MSEQQGKEKEKKENTLVGADSAPFRGVMTLGVLYAFMFSTLASGVLLQMPLLGGALYLLGRVAALYGQMRRPPQDQALSKGQKRLGLIFLCIVLLLMLLLMMIYPISLDSPQLWILCALAFEMTVRPIVTRYLIERDLMRGRRVFSSLMRAIGVHTLFLVPAAALMLLSLPGDTAWYLTGGFVLSGCFEMVSLWRERGQLRAHESSGAQEMEALRGVHAYRMYQDVSLVIAAALQVTQVMTFAFIGITASALFTCMTLAMACTYLACIVTDLILKRTARRERDPGNMLLVGLGIWLYGLVLFSQYLTHASPMGAYLSLALCTCGATVCVRTLTHMEGDVRRMAAFAIGHKPSAAFDWAQNTRVEFSSLLGQMVALAALTLLCMFRASEFPSGFAEIVRGVKPLLTVPALLLVGLALVCALLFPMTGEHIEKLRRYVSMQDKGEENAALRSQLEAVIVRRSLKHYGVKIIIALMRPFYYHRILGRENVHLDEDASCVFVCNHGEIYGPIVTNLYVPFSFRPWVTFEMMEKNVVADYVYENTVKRQKWIPKKIQRPLTDKIIAPVLVWIMRSVDSIPVYHNNPRKLMQTFRETTAAMEAGDNILLFPENSATSDTHHYVREGVSEFFTGFTMIGTLYYNKTGKRAQFVPLYADQQKRTITFGVPTRYDPDAPANEEKERLCEYLRGEMMRIAAAENQPPETTNTQNGAAI